MHFSRHLKQGSVGGERISDGRLFQASMFLKKILEMSSRDDFKGFLQRRHTLRKATLYTLNEIDEVFDTRIPYNGILLNDGSHICYKRTPQYVTITRGEVSKENTNSLSRSRYNAINMIVKRQIMTQSDTEITVRIMMGDCNAVDEMNVIGE
jgi:hypothetical protein